jgi:hypothetical protein
MNSPDALEGYSAGMLGRCSHAVWRILRAESEADDLRQEGSFYPFE